MYWRIESKVLSRVSIYTAVAEAGRSIYTACGAIQREQSRFFQNIRTCTTVGVSNDTL